MKTYKLIKEYPGLLEKGSIAKLGLHGLSEECYEVKEPNKNIYRFDKKTIENNTEFWEEVIDKSYEILSIKGKTFSGMVYYRQGNIFTTIDEKYNITSFPEGAHGCEIPSIKRLSDGEILTVGDTIKDRHGYNLTVNTIWVNPDCKSQLLINHLDEGISLEDVVKVGEKNYEITHMKNSSGNFYALFKGEKPGRHENCTMWSVKRSKDNESFKIGDYITSNYDSKNEDRNIPHPITKMEVNKYGHLLLYTDIFGVGLRINKAVKREKLFTTKDSVDIFKGDKYFQITNDFSIVKCEAFDKHNFDESLIIFSKKENAGEYVLVNKPCLSINDIENKMLNIIGEPYYSNIIRKLKELAKSKL